MANINLLPWREARRQARKQQFLIGLGATLVGAGLTLFLWDIVINSNPAINICALKLPCSIKRLRKFGICSASVIS